MTAPPPPPGFTIDADEPPKRTKAKIPPPPKGYTLDGEAVDGNTLRTNEGVNLRLYGVDAPERDQIGWDRQGNPVRIGDMATIALGDVVTPDGSVGPVLMQSYGRPVTSVDQDGQDVGESVVRQGNALAAPEYMEQSPTLAAIYMEGERLARQNRLGMHGAFAQTPKEYRDNPDYVPDRATIARFWDTLTPFAGLRPEVEAGYVELLKRGTADEILNYAEASTSRSIRKTCAATSPTGMQANRFRPSPPIATPPPRLLILAMAEPALRCAE